LLAGAADIHDDIIDQALAKASKPTVYGRFGKDIAIIASDVLWFKGMLMLNDACEQFLAEKKQATLKLAKQTFFDIGSAEAREVNQPGNIDLQPKAFLDIIKLKISVSMASAQ
jgi:geranylgeranyl pyrophosphate synthase